MAESGCPSRHYGTVRRWPKHLHLSQTLHFAHKGRDIGKVSISWIWKGEDGGEATWHSRVQF